MLGISANMDFFYRHRIEGGWLNGTSDGGQLSLFYKMPSFGFITLEPAFRVDIYNPVKHEKYDKLTTYTYGLNMYAFDDHIMVMMNYYHPMEEISKYMTQTPDDEVYLGLQLTM